ncbi:mannose-specific lectin-like [Chanos chanos]|uniref:Mannose-specific lectin-like n=1 Tax=Chanos chanos TaxID=29144 RepID=A0A6J2VDR3_CHACN|nr:mannose-specific lectin-like [Chanos chanos]
MSRNYMSREDALRKGDSLMSNNREYKAIFQEDGNFVIYGWKPLWASDTWGRQDAHSLRMQTDGNVVIYTKDGSPIWHTNTASSECCNTSHHFYLCDDGNLVLERDLKEVWNSASSKGHKG